MIRIVKADGAAEVQLIDALRSRAAEIGEEINRTAAEMMADVRKRGFGGGTGVQPEAGRRGTPGIYGGGASGCL